MNKSILSWFHQHSANYPLIEREIIERDNRFPNVVSDSIITKTSDENIHRFERFTNEDSPSRKKYLETATSPRRKGGGKNVWHGRGSLTGSTTRQWLVRMAAERVSRVRERERERGKKLLEIFWISHKGSTYVLGTCWRRRYHHEKYTFRGERWWE